MIRRRLPASADFFSAEWSSLQEMAVSGLEYSVSDRIFCGISNLFQ